MIDIDPYVALLDSDSFLQSNLKSLAEDTFNNNEFLTRMVPRENDYFSICVDRVANLIAQHKNVFLSEDAQSLSERLNYRHIYFLSKEYEEGRFINDLAYWITVCLAEEKQKGFEDYILNLLDARSVLPDGIVFETSKDGLVDLSRLGQAKILDHAIDLLDGRRIYLHQFLRRHFSANFVDTPGLLSRAVREGFKVEARIDPFRVGDMRRYKHIIECDCWRGPRFNNQLLESKSNMEQLTVHRFNGVSQREEMCNQYTTIFRTSMLDTGKRLRQFFVEEYAPDLDWLHSPMPGVGVNYVLQKFAHFVYDQNKHSFEHVDCAVRIFTRYEYNGFYRIAIQGNDPGRQIGKRFKLFKISGDLDQELVQDCLYAFFRYNIQLHEYFNGMTFDEAYAFLHPEL